MSNFRSLNGYEVEDSKARIYPNVAAMKTISNLTNGDIIKTAGYYTGGDGGSATYLIRTKTETDVEDLGSIHFINDELVAELLVENNTIFAKQFGVYGNNENDDTEKLNKFFSFERIKKYKKVVNEGIYKITNTIYISGVWHDETINNSIFEIDFTGASLNYQGNNEGCILYLYNHFKSNISNLVITRNSNNGYIGLTKVWHNLFNNFDGKYDLRFNYDKSILPSDDGVYSLMNNKFFNCHIIGNVYMNSQGTYINSIDFENCQLNGNNEKITAIDLHSTGYQNINFKNCDLSYYKDSILTVNDVNTSRGSLTFDSCYFDSITPISKDFNFNGLQVNMINCFDGNPNEREYILHSSDLKKFNFLLNKIQDCNFLPTSYKNLAYNGNLSYKGTNKRKTDYKDVYENLNPTWVETNLNTSKNALQLTFPDGSDSASISFYGLPFPISTYYTVAFRIKKISGTGKFRCSLNGNYFNKDLSNIDDGEDIVLSYTTQQTNKIIEAGTTPAITIARTESTNLIIELLEIILLPGTMVAIDLPLDENAKIQRVQGYSNQRPTEIDYGTIYFDRDLNKPIWWNGTNWVDSTGTIV